MKEYGIKELQRILSSKVLKEPFSVKCDTQLMGVFFPTGVRDRENGLLSGVIDNLIELQKAVEELRNRPMVVSTVPEVMPDLVRCEQPGCQVKTSNPRRRVIFDYEGRDMILCDKHYNLANEVN